MANHRGLKVEIEFVPGSGTWVDVSTKVKLTEGIVIDPHHAGDATTLQLTLDNAVNAAGIAPFTPDSPMATYFPNIERDRQIRVTLDVTGLTFPGAQCTSAGGGLTPGYVVTATADASDLTAGQVVMLYDADGVRKENTLTTISSISAPAFGFVNVFTTSPWWDVPAAGDVLRVVTLGTLSSVRFKGWIDRWQLQATDDLRDSTVLVTASDVGGRYARRELLSVYGEAALYAGRSSTSGVIDYWPLDDGSDATFVRNAGIGGGEQGEVVQPKSDAGGTLELSTPDGGVLVDGIASLARGSSISNAASPVIITPLQTGQWVRRVGGWVQLEEDPAGFDDYATGWAADGSAMWRLGPVADIITGNIFWEIRDAQTGTVLSRYDLGSPADGSWRHITALFGSSGFNCTAQVAVYRSETLSFVAPSLAFSTPGWDGRLTRWVTWGGSMGPYSRGKQTNTLIGRFGSMLAAYTSGPDDTHPYNPAFTGNPGYVYTGATRATWLATYGSDLDTAAGGGFGAGDTDPTPMMGDPRQAGRKLNDAWHLHAQTSGGQLIIRPDGRRQLRTAANLRSSAPNVVLHADLDLNMSDAPWTWERAERATRTTAESPAGSVTVIGDAATEALGLRQDGSTIETVAGTVDAARAAAAAPMTGSGRSRLPAVAVDALTAGEGAWSRLVNMLPGDRVRIPGITGAAFGITQVDGYLAGWVEKYGGSDDRPWSVVFELELEPADDPPESVVDDDRYGRVALGDGAATVTSGTAVGGTGTGTIVVTGTAPLSTSAGDYPAELDWLGECVVVGSAPASSTSPQTLTLTARGQRGTVARVHAAGEAIDAWMAARPAR